MPADELKVDALSHEEWNYLLALFLTDGSSHSQEHAGKKKKRYVVVFYFNAINEEELAHRVTDLLKRAGLNPHIYRGTSKNLISVLVLSESLVGFLPRKKVLKDDVVVRERFFEENKLFDVEGGIPFLAGLLDGDGYFGVNVDKRWSFAVRWKWTFTQSSYLFLVDYIKKFVESLAPNSVGIEKLKEPYALKASFRRSGVDALLNAGIAKYSLKVAQWFEKLGEAGREWMKYYRVGQVAESLDMSQDTVRRWLKTGKMKYKRRTMGSRRHQWYYVRVEEVEKFRKKLLEEREKIRCMYRTVTQVAQALGLSCCTVMRLCKRGEIRYNKRERIYIPLSEVERLVAEKKSMEKIMGEGVKLTDVAEMLDISRNTLYALKRRGELRLPPVGSKGIRRYLVIPKDELENLKNRKWRTRSQKRGKMTGSDSQA